MGQKFRDVEFLVMWHPHQHGANLMGQLDWKGFKLELQSENMLILYSLSG